ncbi:MAG TPA: hypothetical protein VGU61_14715 [Noviherbaspirillum sp.]|jgi:ketosteroid isomerase-like protein|uniref:hypothetical protein n=1 Tax=Noviherbaspirillum sp. TaxID=1926288 RepID=UPI002DDDA110|nr:hypothetical protein [Noviherbaspirillum sp.]HEV2611519.1 hypothetical protein [Noviherbaspirillum sp.]
MSFDTNPRQEVKQFFDDFVEAFKAFDGPLIARRYAAPYVALSGEGVLQSFATQARIGEYFQNVVDHYRQMGCRSCRYTHLEVISLGRNSALATLDWELLHEDGSIIHAWRESYNLAGTGKGLCIFASTDHVG